MSSFASAVVAFFKWNPVRWTLLSLIGLVVAAFAALYGISEWMLARTYERPQITLRTAEPASAERGDRLATILGCQGCHGAHGRIFIDVPPLARIIAPDLARAVANYSDEELAVLIRAGIKRDGTSTVIMPAASFSSMADSDLADVIAWLRALKPEAQTETATTSYRPLGRFLMINGSLPISAEMSRDPSPPAKAPTETRAHGDYLVKTVCTHCHALDEERELKPGLKSPPIRPMTQGYDLEQFTRLLRTGKAIGDRELELMSEVSRGAFSHLTDEEIAAIHAYLNAPSESVATAPAAQ